MNVLFLTAIQVFPPESGGQMRSGNLAKALARAGHKVAIHSFTGRRSDYLNRRRSGETEIEPGLIEYVDRNPLFGVFQFLTYRFNLPNVWFVLPLPFRFRSELRRKWKEADIIVSDFPFHYPLLKRATEKLRILNSHNLEQDIPYGNSNWKRKLIRSLLSRVEERAAAAASIVLACGQKDADFYRNARRLVIEVPNALDPKDSFVPDGAREEIRKGLGISPSTNVLLFTASKYGPNREALDRLREFERSARNRLEALDITLLVVGSVAEKPFKEGRLIATSFVKETKPYFSAADGALNPLTSGSGTNVKMYEYLSFHLPLLSTAFGTRGFSLDEGEDYLGFDWESLLPAIEKWIALGASGRRELAGRAYQKNESLCDMDRVVAERVMPVLSRFTSGGETPRVALDFSTTPA